MARPGSRTIHHLRRHRRSRDAQALPALLQSIVEGLLDERTRLVGVGRAHQDGQAFRADIRKALAAAKFTRSSRRSCSRGSTTSRSVRARFEDFRAARKGARKPLQRIQASAELCVLPLAAAGSDAEDGRGHGRVGAAQARKTAGRGSCSEAVRERPQVRERALRHGHEYFTEEQIYRIDHYLGKETVQNLLVFVSPRLIESAWNRER